MFTIGEFASRGRVSIRMLRHYDEIALLEPARVNPYTGYRFYSEEQLAALAHILSLKDLGLRLDEVTRVIRDDTDEDTLHDLLVARREELALQLQLDTARLRRLDARLRLMEGEEEMPQITAEIKSIPSTRVAETSVVLEVLGPDTVSPVLGPMFTRLADDLARAGVPITGDAVSIYEREEDGYRVHASFGVDDDAVSGEGFTVTTAPGFELAATFVHYGSMASIGESWAALHAWIAGNGYELAGPSREISVVAVPEPQENWVTELQQPVTRL